MKPDGRANPPALPGSPESVLAEIFESPSASRRVSLKVRPMSPAVTMKTIAAHAGVTQATVSMSLANNPRIPAETRDRIRAIAEKLGYRPNPYVSTLMRIRRQGKPLKDRPVLAFVCAQKSADGWRNHPSATIRQLREGALERASLRGYRAQEFWLYRDGMSHERFSEILHARGIQGLLISPAAEGQTTPRLRWEYFAAVGISVPLPNLALTTVCNDHYFSSLYVSRECHERGYRRIGLALLDYHQTRFQGRWEAGVLMAAQMFRGLQVAPLMYANSATDTAALARWLKESRPDVIITPSIDTVPQLTAALNSLELRIPQDIGLAVLSCPDLGAPISGIYQNARLVGAMAVDTLISLLERHELGLPSQATTVMVEGQWNEGRTLRPRG